MEKRLTEDLNVVSNSNLEIQLLDGDLNIIQKLDDEPNDVGGLTSAELKAKFDESGNIIKKYINETLIPSVLTDDATEESRKQAEAARVTAEQGRVTAEEGRVSAESGRVSAEQARSEAEASRVSAETARAQAETARADAERTRANRESTRETAETDRANAEAERASAESARASAEISRTSAESARVQAEASRRTAEDGRVQAEATRASAEQSRASAEAAREAAEKARADETAGIVARATAQADKAESSATAAQSAQNLAKTSERNASSSAQAAQSAASTATNAASSADQSATAASGFASQAQASAAAAAQSAASVDGINKTAQSWAVGGTGTREGEDTNNAKYWAKQAEAVVGGDFATKNEAQGYVTAHNQSADAHSDIRTALNGTEASGTAAAAVAAHNKDTSAHADIREALSKAGKQFIINGTLGEVNGEQVVTVDKTRAEIKATVQNGTPVILHLVIESMDVDMSLNSYTLSESVDMYQFSASVGMVASLVKVNINYSSSGQGSYFAVIQLPSLSNDAPSAPGMASAGTSYDAARADHVHPKEVSDDDRATWNGKASKPTVTTVTLTAAGWNATTKKQTVTVAGVLADTSKQVIWVTQTTEAAIDAYLDAGIVPVAQAANAVTLRADTVPTADITVNIVVQEVQ